VNISLMERLMSIFGFGNDGQPLVGLEQSAKANAIHWVIVDDHDPALEHVAVSLDAGTFHPSGNAEDGVRCSLIGYCRKTLQCTFSDAGRGQP
jgi:hypothetical protein